MKSRIKTRADGKYSVWNYWDPAGPWDFKPDGAPKHWVGVHPQGGYYQIDVEGIVDAHDGIRGPGGPPVTAGVFRRRFGARSVPPIGYSVSAR